MFRVLRIWGLGLGPWGSGFRVLGLGFRRWGSDRVGQYLGSVVFFRHRMRCSFNIARADFVILSTGSQASLLSHRSIEEPAYEFHPEESELDPAPEILHLEVKP